MPGSSHFCPAAFSPSCSSYLPGRRSQVWGCRYRKQGSGVGRIDAACKPSPVMVAHKGRTTIVKGLGLAPRCCCTWLPGSLQDRCDPGAVKLPCHWLIAALSPTLNSTPELGTPHELRSVAEAGGSYFENCHEYKHHLQSL